jgi:hypothetical protein
MYEYISSFERWKNFDKNYLEKYQTINKFIEDCKFKCGNNFECQNNCKKPIIDIERFNLNMIKKLSVDVYDICSNKISNKNEDLTNEINKMKICVENLYRENEVIVKKETIERMDDMIKFLNL